jgi:uncharacterized membrane protein (DUF106 family)
VEGLPDSVAGWMWWIVSVVIVGIFINLFSSFLYPRVEKAIARISGSRKQKLEAQEREFQQKVENLVANPDQITNLKIDLILSHLRAVFYVALGLIAVNVVPEVSGVFWIGTLGYLTLILVVVMVTLSPVLLAINRIRKTNRLVRAAEKRIHS